MIYNIHMKKRRNKNIFGDFFDKFENKFMRGRKEYEDEEYDDDDYETEEDGEYEDDSEYEEEDRDVYEEDEYEEQQNIKERPGDEVSLEIDLIEKDDSLELYAPVPGINSEEVDVSITHDNVTIRAEKCVKEQTTENSFVINEIFCGHLLRSIDLPSEIEVDNSTASVEHGMLHIKMPKINKEKKKRLDIKKK